MADSVAQSVVLAVVDEVVVDVVSVALDEVNPGMGEGGNLAVVDLQARMLGPYTG